MGLLKWVEMRGVFVMLTMLLLIFDIFSFSVFNLCIIPFSVIPMVPTPFVYSLCIFSMNIFLKLFHLTLSLCFQINSNIGWNYIILMKLLLWPFVHGLLCSFPFAFNHRIFCVILQGAWRWIKMMYENKWHDDMVERKGFDAS